MTMTEHDPCVSKQWEAALASAEFYFKSPISNGPVYKMKRINTATFFCARADEESARGSEWDIREIRRYSKYWTLVDSPNKQEKVNVNNLYQKISTKQSVVRGLVTNHATMLARAEELSLQIVEEEAALTDMKRELLRELKKELGS